MTKCDGRGAVVGAAGVVVLRAAAELRERHQRDPGLERRRRACRRTRRPTRRGRAMRSACQVGLVRVRVEPAEVDADDPDAEVGVDELGARARACGRGRSPGTSPWYAGWIRCARSSVLRSVLPIRSPHWPSGSGPLPNAATASNIRASSTCERSIPNAPPMSRGQPGRAGDRADHVQRHRAAEHHAVAATRSPRWAARRCSGRSSRSGRRAGSRRPSRSSRCPST